jgi:GAF domain
MLNQENAIATSNTDALLASTAEHALYLTRACGASIALADERGMRCRVAVGKIAVPVGLEVNPQFGITGACLREGRVFICHDAESADFVDCETCRILGIRSILVVPLVCRGVSVGLLEIFSPQPNAFDRGDCYALQLLAERLAHSLAGQPLALHTASDELKTAVDLVPSPLASPALLGHSSRPHRAATWVLTSVFGAISLWLSWGALPHAKNIIRERIANLSMQKIDSVSSSFEPVSGSPSSNRTASDTPDQPHQLTERPGDKFQLGEVYAKAKGERKNDSELVSRLTRSADQGNVTAAATLGAFYWAGRGVPQNYLDAYVWSAVAKAQGDEGSAYRLVILRTRLSASELSEADKRAAAWLREHNRHGDMIQGQ